MTAKTSVIYRKFIDCEVQQDIDTMFYNATDVLRAYSKSKWTNKQIDEFLSNKTTKEFIEQLKTENLNTGKSGYLENSFSPVIGKRWKYGGTWMHSKLLLDFMMWLSPEFKSKAYDFLIEWFELAGKRHELKEGYKKMCKAICDSGNTNYSNEANMLNMICTWSIATNQRARLGIDKMKQLDDLQITNASLIKAWLPFDDRFTILSKSIS